MKRSLTGTLLGMLLGGLSVVAQDRSGEESRDQYRDWLSEDIVYLISREEREVFEKLSTDDERAAFIEQFWLARDPDPTTAANEFREEHYRRIAYANDKFHAGKPGWKTDRGMIYIKFGPPDRRQTNPTGGRVFRSQRELAASDRLYAKDAMTALPYEVWEYRYLEGIGSDVSFEFVSMDGSPEYKLALSPEDKDALFFNTGSHLPKQRNRNYGLKIYGGNPLDRVERHAQAFKPLPARVPESFVSAQVHFSELPFEVRADPKVEGTESVIDLTVEVPHRSLSFNRQIDSYAAQVQMEIFIRDVRKVVMAHQAENLETEISQSEFKQAIKESSVYQTRFTLPAGRYLIDVWIKDVVGDMASLQQVLAVAPKPESK